MFTFTLTHIEEEHAPPSQVVLDVCVVGDTVFLDICEYEEDHESRQLTVLKSIAVDGHALAAGLVASSEESVRNAKRNLARREGHDHEHVCGPEC